MTEITIADQYDADFETRKQELDADNDPLAWTPDDELVYTLPPDQSVIVYITHLNSIKVAKAIRLPAICASAASTS